jgi:hypothetical protein
MSAVSTLPFRLMNYSNARYVSGSTVGYHTHLCAPVAHLQRVEARSDVVIGEIAERHHGLGVGPQALLVKRASGEQEIARGGKRMNCDLVANLLQPRSQTSEVGLIESKHSVGLNRTNASERKREESHCTVTQRKVVRTWQLSEVRAALARTGHCRYK